MSDQKLSISEISARLGLDRATVRTRLQEAGVEPEPGKKGAKLYDLEQAEELLVPESDEAYGAARARKTIAEATLKEMEIAKLRGDLLPAYEVREQVQRIIQRLYQKFAIQQPKELAGRLAKLKASPAVEKLLREESARIFQDLRRDHAKMLEEQSG